MQSNHFTGHDLDLLESYIYECIHQLPKLPSAADAAGTDAGTQIPTRCSSYHIVCANMLKKVVALLSLYSPRLCRLIGQVWDLTSLNVFVLLQVANAALQKTQRLHDQLVSKERVFAESLEQQSILMQRYEDEIASHRVNEQSLRAELQKVRQCANRLTVENGQLQLVIRRVRDAQDTMEATRFDGFDSGVIRESDEMNESEDIAVDVDESKLYGVEDSNEDTLARVEPVCTFESFLSDFEQHLRTLLEGEERSVCILNEIDRFSNSKAVSLLWRYASVKKGHQMMHNMLRTSTISTQTDETFSQKPRYSARSGDYLKVESEDNDWDSSQYHKQRDRDENDMQRKATSEVATIVKHQMIPATLRAQLDTRPQIRRVLEKKHLNRILLRLYLEKLECDARTLRQERIRTGLDGNAVSITVVRRPLHCFMKDFFRAQYKEPALADFHLVEVVESCLHYHEQLQITLHRSADRASTALMDCLPRRVVERSQHAQATRHHDFVSELDQQLQDFDAADVRIALFNRLCDLVPFALDIPTDDFLAAGEHQLACLFNAVVDLLGDILELDPAVSSLAAVEETFTEENWSFPRDLAFELLTHHLSFVDQDILENTRILLARLVPLSYANVTADCIAVDIFLALFATTWIKSDRRLERKLRDTFHHQLIRLSSLEESEATKEKVAADDPRNEYGQLLHRDSEGMIERPRSRTKSRHPSIIPQTIRDDSIAISMHSTPLKSLAKIWSMLEDEKLSLQDVEELKHTFRRVLEAKKLDTKSCQSLPSVQQCNNVAGVTEKEFVVHTLQVLRRRRNNYGLRTNSTFLPNSTKYGSFYHETLQREKELQAAIPLTSLKPGLGEIIKKDYKIIQQ